MTEEIKTNGPGTLTEIDESPVEMSLELQGKIFLIEKNVNGEEISRSELDGEVMLQALVGVLVDSMVEQKEPEEQKA